MLLFMTGATIVRDTRCFVKSASPSPSLQHRVDWMSFCYLPSTKSWKDNVGSCALAVRKIPFRGANPDIASHLKARI